MRVEDSMRRRKRPTGNRDKSQDGHDSSKTQTHVAQMVFRSLCWLQ